MKRYTKADFAPMIAACSMAGDAVTAAADKRHLCEKPWDDSELNSTYHNGYEAQKLATVAREALRQVQIVGEALSVGLEEEDYKWAWGHADRIRKALRCAGLTNAQIGGTPALDWAHAAELRFFADTFTRCGS